MPQCCWGIQKIMIYWLLVAKKCSNHFSIKMLSFYISRRNSCGPKDCSKLKTLENIFCCLCEQEYVPVWPKLKTLTNIFCVCMNRNISQSGHVLQWQTQSQSKCHLSIRRRHNFAISFYLGSGGRLRINIIFGTESLHCFREKRKREIMEIVLLKPKEGGRGFILPCVFWIALQ